MDRIRTLRLRDHIKSADEDLMPRHISMIMDGNRRFAWNQNIERDAGHAAGKERLKEVMRWVLDLRIRYLTVYALSTENIEERAGDELDTLYDLYVTGLDEICADPLIHNNRV